MDEIDEKIIDASLAEYSALRAEVISYTQRLDTTISIYLTALAAVLGFIVQPTSLFDGAAYLRKIQTEREVAVAIMLIGTLNSMLLIRMQSLYAGLLAIAQYTAMEIAPKIRRILRANVLQWDTHTPSALKRTWTDLRKAGQVMFALSSIAVSVLAIYLTYTPAREDHAIGPIYLVQCAMFIYCIHAVWISKEAAQRFGEGALTSGSPSEKGRYG